MEDEEAEGQSIQMLVHLHHQLLAVLDQESQDFWRKTHKLPLSQVP